MIDKYFKVSKDGLQINLQSLNHVKKFWQDTFEDVYYQNCSKEETARRIEWCGGDVAKFEDVLVSGDAEMIKNIKDVTDKKLNELLKIHHTISKDYLLGVEGEFFDVGILLSGEPEHWFKETTMDGKKETPRVEININGAYSHRVKSETVMENSSLVLAYCKLLEMNGVQTKINVHFISKKEHYTGTKRSRYSLNEYDYFITIKDFEDKISYYKLSTVLHPVFFRRGLLRIKEARWDKKQNDGYGVSVMSDKNIQLNNSDDIKQKFEKFFE